jgi:hypothetical protein
MTEHHDDRETYDDFRHAVNMTKAELSRWLDSDDSKAVGQKQGDHESTGHASGRRIVTLLETKKGVLGADDYAHMRKVVGYVKRHLAQRPDGDVTDTPWRYSLMNWGHDPTK